MYPLDTAFGKSAHRDFGGAPQSNNARNILSACTPLPLMIASKEQRLKQRAATNVQGANSLRSVELVSRNREQIATDLAHVNRNLAYCLHRVSMKIDIGFSSNSSDLFN